MFVEHFVLSEICEVIEDNDKSVKSFKKQFENIYQNSAQ